MPIMDLSLVTRDRERLQTENEALQTRVAALESEKDAISRTLKTERMKFSVLEEHASQVEAEMAKMRKCSEQLKEQKAYATQMEEIAQRRAEESQGLRVQLRDLKRQHAGIVAVRDRPRYSSKVDTGVPETAPFMFAVFNAITGVNMNPQHAKAMGQADQELDECYDRLERASADLEQTRQFAASMEELAEQKAEQTQRLQAEIKRLKLWASQSSQSSQGSSQSAWSSSTHSEESLKHAISKLSAKVARLEMQNTGLKHQVTVTDQGPVRSESPNKRVEAQLSKCLQKIQRLEAQLATAKAELGKDDTSETASTVCIEDMAETDL